MDQFAECLVRKQPDASDRMKGVLLIIAAVLITAISILFVYLTKIPFLLLVTCAAIYGVYYLVSGLSVEYEYAVTNDEIDVDKIIAKRKRVHLLTASIRKFEAFGPAEEMPEEDDRTLVLCADNTGEGEYYADVETEEYGSTRILFTPDTAVLEAVKEALPHALRMQQKSE